MNFNKIAGAGLIAAALLIVVYQYRKYRVAPKIDFSDITLQTTEGTPYVINLKGNKITVVSFFATWCGPCRHEFKLLEQLHHQGKASDIRMIAISDEPENELKQFRQYISDTSITILHATPSLKTVGIYTYPTGYIFSENGNLLYKSTGIIDFENYSTR